jgi:hypothetical protein
VEPLPVIQTGLPDGEVLRLSQIHIKRLKFSEYIYKAAFFRAALCYKKMFMTMRSGINFCFLAIVLWIAACNNAGKKEKAGSQITSDSAAAVSFKTGLTTEPLLQQADSLQILYYDNPDGDSLRYTRFYRYTATKDSSTVNTLLNNLRLTLQPQNEVRHCRSEGKIYVFSKKEEPIKTLYFSTRCDSCCYLYFIKEGVFYYSPLTENFKNKLKENKQLSRAP